MAMMTQSLAKISTFSIMKPVEILKKGLAKLCGQIQGWKTELEAKLKACHPISEAADQDWLDGDGNLIHEERVVEILDNVSDWKSSWEKENVTLKQWIKILDWYNMNGRNQTKTAKHFHTIYPHLKIKQPLVSA